MLLTILISAVIILSYMVFLLTSANINKRNTINDLIKEFENIKSKDSEKEKTLKNVYVFENDNPDIPPHVLHFMAGQKNAWNLIQVAIYKMYRDGNLLSCENMIEGILTELENFTDDKKVDKLNTEIQILMSRYRRKYANGSSSHLPDTMN